MIPSHPRANKPNRRGMVLRRQGIPAPLARLEHAPTRHSTQNPGWERFFSSAKKLPQKNLGKVVRKVRVTKLTKRKLRDYRTIGVILDFCYQPSLNPLQSSKHQSASIFPTRPLSSCPPVQTPALTNPALGMLPRHES